MCGCGQNLTNKRNRFFFFFKERQRERDRDRETGRKARHQQGFSFVKQEVWGTKGQTAWLFQSVPMLSHCFHCHNSRRALYPALLCLSQQNASKKSICCVCIHVGVCTAVKTKKNETGSWCGINKIYAAKCVPLTAKFARCLKTHTKSTICCFEFFQVVIKRCT